MCICILVAQFSVLLLQISFSAHLFYIICAVQDDDWWNDPVLTSLSLLHKSIMVWIIFTPQKIILHLSIYKIEKYNVFSLILTENSLLKEVAYNQKRMAHPQETTIPGTSHNRLKQELQKGYHAYCIFIARLLRLSCF